MSWSLSHSPAAAEPAAALRAIELVREVGAGALVWTARLLIHIFCRHGGCNSCLSDVEGGMRERRAVMEHLGGLDLRWHRRLVHPVLPDLPDHLPVLVQAYADAAAPAGFGPGHRAEHVRLAGRFSQGPRPSRAAAPLWRFARCLALLWRPQDPRRGPRALG
ncbi:MAG TPA: hypothetical protein VKK19_15295, partial [Candidatus Dormibacteraeota bacterium]|nr:hypothetical protein [Candidatus Dormibacteraeota bacterium]